MIISDHAKHSEHDQHPTRTSTVLANRTLIDAINKRVTPQDATKERASLERDAMKSNGFKFAWNIMPSSVP